MPDQINPLAAVLKEVEVRFAVYYGRAEFAAAAALLAAGDIDTRTFVTGHVDLGGVTWAFRTLLSTTTERKVLVHPSGVAP